MNRTCISFLLLLFVFTPLHATKDPSKTTLLARILVYFKINKSTPLDSDAKNSHETKLRTVGAFFEDPRP